MVEGLAHRALADASDQGVAVLLISSEPETIIANSDRTLVMSKGRITKEFADEEVTKATLLRSA